jgi:hypothetical protein
MKSAAVVLNVTSAAAVPVVGLTARSFRVYFGAARLVPTVIFFSELLIPQRRLVAVFVTGPIKSCPAVTFARAIVRFTLPELTATLVIVATVTVTVLLLSRPYVCAWTLDAKPMKAMSDASDTRDFIEEVEC